MSIGGGYGYGYGYGYGGGGGGGGGGKERKQSQLVGQLGIGCAQAKSRISRSSDDPQLRRSTISRPVSGNDPKPTRCCCCCFFFFFFFFSQLLFFCPLTS
ncbi:hypothetical protein NDA14_007072 [Ustilago hordei]|nr:hypothetical protein NDA12_005930 [Ustilago hordei]KAJ1574531.1 hypothetical protein NDA15_004857 [Ustilago hordei]KAJ1599640.1 hypothetical protein NDA14_007072 [Ustilago hordei]